MLVLPTDDSGDDLFRYTDHAGKTWVSDVPVADVFKPGLLRRHRNNDLTLVMEAAETLFAAQPEFLALIDEEWDEMTAVMRTFLDHIQGKRTAAQDN